MNHPLLPNPPALEARLLPFRWIGRTPHGGRNGASEEEVSALTALCLDPGLDPNLQSAEGDCVLGLVLAKWPGWPPEEQIQKLSSSQP
jgi:hypothetical protein